MESFHSQSNKENNYSFKDSAWKINGNPIKLKINNNTNE